MKKGKFVVIKGFPEEIELKLNDLIRQGYGVEIKSSNTTTLYDEEGDKVTGLIVTVFIHKENPVIHHRIGGTE